MRNNQTSQEKLLGLIRGAKKQEGSIVGAPSLASLGTSFMAPAGKATEVRADGWHFLAFSLTLPNFLWIIFGVSCLYLAGTFVYPLLALRKIKLPDISAHPAGYAQTEKSEVIPYEPYEQAISSRQIFAVDYSNSIENEAAQSQNANAAADFIKNLNLVGIIAGDSPQAVIEDKNIQKTFYLNRGEVINGFRVESIEEGKVVLAYKGEKYELHL